MSERRGSVGTYEITVQGLLGPLLLSTLPHTAAARVERHSLLLMTSSDHADLVDLLRRIDDSGLEVDTVRVVSQEIA